MPINHHEHQIFGEGLTRTASGETLISVQRLAKEVGKPEGEVEAALRSGLLSARKIRDFSGKSIEAINLVSARLHFNLSDLMTQRLYRPDTEDLSVERLKVLWPEPLTFDLSNCRYASHSRSVVHERGGDTRASAKALMSI